PAPDAQRRTHGHGLDERQHPRAEPHRGDGRGVPLESFPIDGGPGRFLRGRPLTPNPSPIPSPLPGEGRHLTPVLISPSPGGRGGVGGGVRGWGGPATPPRRRRAAG